MANLVDKVNSIEVMILELIKLRNTVIEENDSLKKRVKADSTKISNLEMRIQNLKAENRDLKTANALLGSDEFKRETKLKINSLVKEIDQCIIQLSE